jgi:WAS family protein 1
MAQVQNGQSYKVSLIYHDLELSETVQDTFHALEHLNVILNDVFTKIDNRVQEENKRLISIKKRTAICQDKVRQLRGSNQAVTVFSTAKYPAPKQLPASKSLLGQINEVSFDKFSVYFYLLIDYFL